MKGTHQCDFINFCGAFGPQLDSEMHQISLDIAVSSQKQARCFKTSQIRCFCTSSAINLPGWRWAGIKQLALVGSSSSLHSEACKALGGSDGVIHSRISGSGDCVRAGTNKASISLRVRKTSHNPRFWIISWTRSPAAGALPQDSAHVAKRASRRARASKID